MEEMNLGGCDRARGREAKKSDEETMKVRVEMR